MGCRRALAVLNTNGDDVLTAEEIIRYISRVIVTPVAGPSAIITSAPSAGLARGQVVLLPPEPGKEASSAGQWILCRTQFREGLCRAADLRPLPAGRAPPLVLGLRRTPETVLCSQVIPRAVRRLVVTVKWQWSAAPNGREPPPSEAEIERMRERGDGALARLCWRHGVLTETEQNQAMVAGRSAAEDRFAALLRQHRERCAPTLEWRALGAVPTVKAAVRQHFCCRADGGGPAEFTCEFTDAVAALTPGVMVAVTLSGEGEVRISSLCLRVELDDAAGSALERTPELRIVHPCHGAECALIAPCGGKLEEVQKGQRALALGSDPDGHSTRVRLLGGALNGRVGWLREEELRGEAAGASAAPALFRGEGSALAGAGWVEIASSEPLPAYPRRLDVTARWVAQGTGSLAWGVLGQSRRVPCFSAAPQLVADTANFWEGAALSQIGPGDVIVFWARARAEGGGVHVERLSVQIGFERRPLRQLLTPADVPGMIAAVRRTSSHGVTHGEVDAIVCGRVRCSPAVRARWVALVSSVGGVKGLLPPCPHNSSPPASPRFGSVASSPGSAAGAPGGRKLRSCFEEDAASLPRRCRPPADRSEIPVPPHRSEFLRCLDRCGGRLPEHLLGAVRERSPHGSTAAGSSAAGSPARQPPHTARAPLISSTGVHLPHPPSPRSAAAAKRLRQELQRRRASLSQYSGPQQRAQALREKKAAARRDPGRPIPFQLRCIPESCHELRQREREAEAEGEPPEPLPELKDPSSRHAFNFRPRFVYGKGQNLFDCKFRLKTNEDLRMEVKSEMERDAEINRQHAARAAETSRSRQAADTGRHPSEWDREFSPPRRNETLGDRRPFAQLLIQEPGGGVTPRDPHEDAKMQRLAKRLRLKQVPRVLEQEVASRARHPADWVSVAKQ